MNTHQHPDFFQQTDHPSYRPLADRMRPQTPDDFVGQSHLFADGKPLRTVIETGALHSMVFWGPPGTGKTTLARMFSQQTGALFIAISAVLAGVREIREAISQAREVRQMEDRKTILFVDEAHRFNKSQQDAFLPHIEDGTIFFIGATTENPSFELNNALLSRVRVYPLKRLDQDDLRKIVDQALSDAQRGLGQLNLAVDNEVRDMIASAADGDARRALNFLEIAVDLIDSSADIPGITAEIAREVVAGGVRRFDKRGDDFYDQISALHKSVRGSSPDASLYWLSRMLDGGCDPLYIARRVVRMASEDIGNADPRGLQLALNAWDVQDRLGSPEGELAIAQAVVYLACAPKSNAVYTAFNTAMKDAAGSGSLEVPMHLRNAPTSLMKSLGHSEGYRYAHEEADAYAAGERYFPDTMQERIYYQPTSRGYEERIAARLREFRKRDKAFRDRKRNP